MKLLPSSGMAGAPTARVQPPRRPHAKPTPPQHPPQMQKRRRFRVKDNRSLRQRKVPYLSCPIRFVGDGLIAALVRLIVFAAHATRKVIFR